MMLVSKSARRKAEALAKHIRISGIDSLSGISLILRTWNSGLILPINFPYSN